MSDPRRSTIARILVGVALVALATTPTHASEVQDRDDPHLLPRRSIVKTRRIAPGLVYTKIVQRSIPRRTFVLRVDPTRPLTLDVTLSKDALPARRILSEVVSLHGAIAAVNGDYSGNPVGDPVHPLAQDGELLQTSDALGTLFALSADESQTFFGRPELSIVATDLESGRSHEIERWNDGSLQLGEIVGYSPLGGTLESPPPYACSARLLPTGAPTLAAKDGVDRDFVVDEASCSEAPMARSGGVVLAAHPATDEATWLLSLHVGTPFRLHWTFGWPGVLDAVGGAPLLLQDGKIVGDCYSCGPQPRTSIGVTASGKILLVVVDGRQPRWSVGPTMAELAQIMLDLGAVDALNLDGGGSSEMVVEGEVVNRPSDGRERPISNAILVLPGPDPEE